MSSAGQIELRPMGVGDILDTAFRLYRMRFVSFFAISLVMFVPYIVLLLVLSLLVGNETHLVQTPYGPREMEPVGAMLVNTLATMLYFLAVWPLVGGALMFNISAAYLGESLSVGTCYRRAASRLGALLGTQMLVGFVVVLGMLLLIIPGIIFSLWYVVIAPVVLLEGLAGGRAMSRSKALMSGNLGKGFLIGLTVFVLNIVITLAMSYCLDWVGLTHPAAQRIGAEAVQAVTLPFLLAPTILLYYDLRIRKEAFDLQCLSAALTAEPAAPV
jgi:hypothetical protein